MTFWAYLEMTGEVAVKTVTETYVNETDELVHIGVNGETISATPSHPFYVDKLGWTLARSLRAGDVLVLSNGELVVVEWVQHEILESPIKVYNFEVEDWHTYFVGENSVFVHNGCGDESIPHGNSKESKKSQHGYEIYDTFSGEPVKTGISGGKLNKDESSRRANSQVNKWNKEPGNEGRYYAEVVKTDMPDRATALEWEKQNATRLHDEGYELNKHQRPRPWENK